MERDTSTTKKTSAPCGLDGAPCAPGGLRRGDPDEDARSCNKSRGDDGCTAARRGQPEGACHVLDAQRRDGEDGERSERDEGEQTTAR